MSHKLTTKPVSRINVIGTSGSGKSTFSRKLAAALQVPHIEMDKVYWGKDWTYLSHEEYFEKLKQILDQSAWVLDGNYAQTIPVKWKNVQMVIWLDYSFTRTLWQAVKRAVWRAWSQEEIWEGTGNRETFRKSFLSKDSIIWWTITTYGKIRKRHEGFMQDPQYQHIHFVRLKNHTEAEYFLERIKNENSH